MSPNGGTAASSKSTGDIAKEACDDAFKDQISKITGLLSECLSASGNPTAEQDCITRYKAGLEFAKKVHEISLNVVNQVFSP